MLIDPEPLLPTRGYRVPCHDATLIDLEAEGMWPMGTQLELTVTIIRLGRRLCEGIDAKLSNLLRAAQFRLERRAGLTPAPPRRKRGALF